MAATVVFGPFVGVSLSLMATQYTSTGVAMTIMSLSPVLILWPAHVLFGQRVTRREVVGALISVAGGGALLRVREDENIPGTCGRSRCRME